MKKCLVVFCLITVVLVFSTHVKASLIDVNLLQNSGFEQSMKYWNPSGGASTGSGNTVPGWGTVSPHSGKLFLVAGNSGFGRTYQDIDLLSTGFTASWIDQGIYDISFGGYQGGRRQGEIGRTRLQIYDEGNQLIADTSTAWFSSGIGWWLKSGSTSLPEGARYLRFLFEGTRKSGNVIDAYLDDAFVTVHQTASPVPEPGSVWLIGTGLIGLSMVLRRSN
ncbi:MAG: PEP-CTERM sorting domain-containing protein [Desulfobacter sp.]